LAIAVQFASSNGTATLAGNDYTQVSGILTFAANTKILTQTITVPTTDNTKFEPNETVYVNLTNATNATIVDNQGIGTIVNSNNSLIVVVIEIPGRHEIDTVAYLPQQIPLTKIIQLLGNENIKPFHQNINDDGYVVLSSSFDKSKSDKNTVLYLSYYYGSYDQIYDLYAGRYVPVYYTFNNFFLEQPDLIKPPENSLEAIVMIIGLSYMSKIIYPFTHVIVRKNNDS
jgi:hypothetical protein